MFIKKTLVFIITLIMVISICTVDTAYSDMMNKESLIAPTIEKTNNNYIVFTMFGKSANLNINEVKDTYNEIIKQFQQKLYGQNSPVPYSNIPRQTL